MTHVLWILYPEDSGTEMWFYFVEITVASLTGGKANILAHTQHCHNDGLMLGQRRRRLTNIKPALGQYLVIVGCHYSETFI